jgi:hypothetical protein
VSTDQPDDVEPFDLPDAAFGDESAVRKMVLRGVLRTGFAAASWLLVLVLVLLMAGAGVEVLRGETFRVAQRGLAVAHPEYEIAQHGPCCSDGPTSLFLTSSYTVSLRVRGASDAGGESVGTVRRGVFGDLEVDLVGRPEATPIGEALARGRTDKAATRAFLGSLPKAMTTSAIIEFTQPAGGKDFHNVVDTLDVRPGPVFLTDPYGTDGQTVSWPNPVVSEFGAWARELRDADNDDLDALGLPPADRLKAVADRGLVYAYVLRGPSVEELSKLLDNPAIRSVNVVDVQFDLARQRP